MNSIKAFLHDIVEPKNYIWRSSTNQPFLSATTFFYKIERNAKNYITCSIQHTLSQMPTGEKHK